MSNIVPFAFEGNEIRIIERDGEVLFVLADVCRVLGINNPSAVASRLDNDEKNSLTLSEGNRGNPNVTAVNEAGFYRVVMRSDSPLAKPFQKWVTSEVLPSIRKTGSYGAPHAPQLDTNFAREVRLQTKMFASMAKMIGLEGNQLALSVNNGVRSIMGVDILTGMGLERLPAPVNEPDLTPTDIGNRLGGMPARQINSALCQYEYQIRHRDLKGRIYYELTDKGRDAGGTYKDTGKNHSDGTPVKQLMWAASIVDHLEAEMGVMA